MRRKQKKVDAHCHFRRGVALHVEWGDWLSTFAWTHCVTLTFNPFISPSNVLTFFRRYVSQLEKTTRANVYWYAAVEGADLGFPHIHAVLMVVGSLSLNELRRHWKKGISSVAKYDRERGVAYYITKEMARDNEWDDYDICLPPAPAYPDREDDHRKLDGHQPDV